jgi:K+-transporting ATPase KdpF subunit
MTIDFLVGGAVTVLLLAYITYALIWPERL